MLTGKPNTNNDANASTLSSATDLDTGSSSDTFSKSDPVNRIRRVFSNSSIIEKSPGSYQPAVSNSGRYIAFASQANNLVTGDTNGVTDIFIYDSKKQTTKRISVGLQGSEANAASAAPSISRDGRYVAFESSASNLVDGDTNGKKDIFVYDMKTSQIRLVSKDSSGTQSNGDSSNGLISGNGRYVAFASAANNLEGGDSDDGRLDVFLHDLQTGSTTFVTRNNEGPGIPGRNVVNAFPKNISADGRYVLYQSNLRSPMPIAGPALDIYDRETGTNNRLVKQPLFLDLGAATISGDGRYAAYVVVDIANPGKRIALFDRQTGTGSNIPIIPNDVLPNSAFGDLFFSNDGRYLAFTSFASNLVEGDTNNQPDVFVHDRQTGQTKRVSVDAKGTQGNGPSFARSISADGRTVTFVSQASNLVPGDTNNAEDVFAARNFFS